MKYWLTILLVVFIAVAGYQFGYYRGKLVNSNSNMERLNTVLERSRSTSGNNLKIIQSTIIASSGEAQHKKALADALPERMVDTTTISYAQSHLANFLNAHPNGKALTLNTLTCTSSQCELKGQYSGTQAALTQLLEDLKLQAWWQYTDLQEVTRLHNGVTQVGIVFSLHDTRKKEVTT